MLLTLPLLLAFASQGVGELAGRLQALECRDSKALRDLLVSEAAFGERLENERCALAAQACAPIDHGWWTNVRVGCARATTSSDGRVRTWTSHPPDGRLTADREPLGHLTWKDAAGVIRIYRGDESRDGLHLGGIIDAIHRLPDRDRYLVLGITYGLRGPVRRFAYVLRLDGARPEKVGEMFRIRGRKRAELVLEGDPPDTGKFRHHELAQYHLRYYPTATEIVLEGISDRPPLPPRTAAVLKGGLFVVADNERMKRMVETKTRR